MTRQFPPHRTRGSVLVVSLIFAAFTGVALASYIALTTNSLKLANRSFYANSAMNLAEIGLEQTLACFNQIDNVGYVAAWPTTSASATATLPAFSGWTLNSGAATATATYSNFNIGPGATGAVKLYVHYYDGSGINVPVIVAKATISSNNGPEQNKFIEVTLRKRSLFGNGLFAYDDIRWVGTPDALSWNSDPDGNPATAAVPYTSIAQNTAKVTVGSVNGNISLGSNGVVWGYAKTGPDKAATGGSVQGLTGGNDDSRRTNDFNASLPDPGLPAYTTTAGTINNINTQIKNATTFGASGTYGANTQTINGTLYYVYNFTSPGKIDPNGTAAMTIAANSNVMFIMQGYSGSTVINTNGNNNINIPAGSSLTIYTDGDISMNGNGSTNGNASPASFSIYGTNPSSQSIAIGGGADLKVVIDAPHAAVSLGGNGSVMGAVVAKTIDMGGTPTFIWDESLASITVGNPYGISKWKELQSQTDRGAYASQLNF